MRLCLVSQLKLQNPNCLGNETCHFICHSKSKQESVFLLANNSFVEWNVTKVIQCRELMNSSGMFLWTLLIHDKKLNMLSFATNAMVLTWWSFETHMSTNRKEIVKKCLMPHVYDYNPPQHLLETQVLSTLSLFDSILIV